MLPASIIKAYCIRGLSFELDFEHFVVPRGPAIFSSVIEVDEVF